VVTYGTQSGYCRRREEGALQVLQLVGVRATTRCAGFLFSCCGAFGEPTGEKLLISITAGVEMQEGDGTRRWRWMARGPRGGESLLAQTGASRIRKSTRNACPARLGTVDGRSK
jgi:hypothetical protein